MAIALISGQFAGVSASFAVALRGAFNLMLSGAFVATVQLERSFDGGLTWQVVSRDAQGAPAGYTAACNLSGDEPEPSVLYRVNCTAFTSGPVGYRLSQ